MKKAILIFLCVILAAGVFSGCNPEEKPYVPTGNALEGNPGATVAPTKPPEQNLTMCYYADRTMNPYAATEFTNRALFPLLYQGLFTVDAAYQVSPVLCESYSVSADMRTYKFSVAKARFSDGTALTAADVLASLNAAKAGAYYGGRFLHVQSMSLEGEQVVIQMDTPFENLPLLLDMPIVKASEVESDRPLGTGPYQLDTSVGGMRLRRQAGWWCSASLAVTAAYIPLVEASSPSQIRDQFEFADVGLVLTDPGSDTYADYRCDYEIWDSENGLFLFLVCNESSEVFSVDAVRRALTHAIDRDYLVDTFYRGFARSACLPASPMSPCYNPTLAEKYGLDSQKFTDALTEANLQGAPVTLLLNSDDSLRLRAGRAIAKMLKTCGLEVTVLELNSKDFREKLKQGEYDLYLGQTKLSPNMDLTAFYKQGGALSYGNLADPAIYAMGLEALANSGNFYSLHEMVMEDAQLCPVLVRCYAIYATRGLITGLEPARDNIFHYTLGRTLADALTREEPAA